MIGNLRSFVKELNKTDLVAFIAALFAGAAMSRYLSMGTANPYALVFLLLLFPIFRQALKVKSKRARAAGAVSADFSWQQPAFSTGWKGSSPTPILFHATMTPSST